MNAFYPKSLLLLLALLVAIPAWAQAQSGAAPEWPVEIKDAKATIVIYQPQPEALKGNILTGRFAAAVTAKGSTVTVYGAAWFTADLDTDLDNNTWVLKQIKITKAKSPTSTPEGEKKFAELVETAMLKKKLHGSLAVLMDGLKAEQRQQQAADNLNTKPPKILIYEKPTVLVLMDGRPKTEVISGTKLERVVNTPMMMIYDPGNSMYFLTSGEAWYGASKMEGPWRVQTNLPRAVSELVTQNGKPLTAPSSTDKELQIVVTLEPAEMIVTEGKPQMQALGDTGLNYLSNSASDVFMEIDSQRYYYLVSGRWFSAPALAGPWEFINPKRLPPAFAKIPPDSTKGNVLASVPGTPQADEALLAAQIPQTATVQRSQAKLTVTYNGEPKFKPIEGTSMQYAENTATPVLLIAGKYYACDNAIWFTAPTAKGLWTVASSIPKDIQSLPPDCPVYNVKYVYVYDSTPDTVYVGYTSGYMGYYPYYGCVVYGTGYYYSPWYGSYYYPRPVTYGYGVCYSPYYGWNAGVAWGVGFIAVGAMWHGGFYGGYYPGYHPPMYGGYPGYPGYRPPYPGGRPGGVGGVGGVGGAGGVGGVGGVGGPGRPGGVGGPGGARPAQQPSINAGGRNFSGGNAGVSNNMYNRSGANQGAVRSGSGGASASTRPSSSSGGGSNRSGGSGGGSHGGSGSSHGGSGSYGGSSYHGGGGGGGYRGGGGGGRGGGGRR